MPTNIMKLEDIGFYTLSDYRASQVSKKSPLWRCELLLTDKCNFRCPYCRGSNEYTRGTLSFDRAKHIVNLWSNGKLKNIRFSGGEPTIYEDIVGLVDYTRSKGIERIAISTNGSASISLYEDIISAGANDFSVSLDACCSSVGDMMAGNKLGSWNKVVKSIEYLSSKVYVTVGVVLTDDNYLQLVETINFADKLGVSDIRIISAAQENTMNLFRKAIECKLDINKPILKYRLQNIMSDRNVRGIRSTDSNRCGLVLDDMAIAGNHHFPCIISLREGCEPIGTIDDKTIEQIREERYQWFLSTNTHCNKICHKNCLDVCVDYNNKVEA